MKKPLGERRFAMEGLLLVATLFWGMSNLWCKDITQTGVETNAFVAIRYGLAVLLLLPICWKDLCCLTGRDVVHCLILGVLYYSTQLTQVIGLRYTTPANCSFITSAYVVLMPITSAIVMREKPQKKVLVSILLCVAGLYALNFTPGEGLQINVGNAIILFCALLWAIQITYLSYAGRTTKTTVLTILPFFFAAVLAAIAALLRGGFSMEGVDQKTLYTTVILLAIFPTVASGLAQTYAQKVIEPTRAAIIYTMESVFACLLSILLGYEPLTGHLLVGGGLIVTAILLTELPIGTKKRRNL